MRVFIAATLLALLPLFAYAEEGATTTYSSDTWDFTLTLPDGGAVSDAGSEGWEYEDPTIFAWVTAQPDSPVFLIMGSAMALDVDATDSDVADFVNGLTDEENNIKNNVAVEEVSDTFYVGERGWISVLFKDNNEASTGEFEVFVTRQGVHIYAIAFHYLDQTEAGETTAEAVLTSFVTSGG